MIVSRVRALTPAELPEIGRAAICMGTFDGVHAGHRHLVRATADAARRLGVACVALVFWPHPAEVLRPGTRITRLLPPWEVPGLLAAAGALHAPVLRFDHDLRALAPEEFLDALRPRLEPRAIVMTATSAFGRGRSGTLERMRQIGVLRGFEAVEVGALGDEGGAPISSTRIRDALAAGQLDAAAEMLGRRPRFVGRVIHGDRRGRSLGFPTANLAFDYHPALPRLGIYTGRVSVPERAVGPGHPALVSIGVRPTFHDSGQVLVEVYLLDWDGDLYDAELELELSDRLREERRFESVDELVAQMRADEAEARRRLASEAGSPGR